MYQQPSKIEAPWPAAPGINGTIIMACTAPKVATGGTGITPPVKLPRGPRSVDAIEIVWLENDQAGAANGIRVYALKKDGATWREVDVRDDNGNATIGASALQTVGILVSPAERRLLIDVSRYRAVAVEYTAGGTAPTAWDGIITLHMDAEAIIR